MDRDPLLELATLVAAMRQAQTTYFKTRRPVDLDVSKTLERQVDAKVQAILHPPTVAQPDLFGSEAAA